jgi:3'-5' exoribonuclease
VTFRDARREVSFPIWGDSTWAAECRDQWQPGVFYKLRAVYRETNYGPQLEIRRIRPATDADAADGFDPQMCLPSSRFDPEAMYGQLVELARNEIRRDDVRRFVEKVLADHRAGLVRLPAARRHHHAYVGGLIEHVLCVARTCVYLADRYAEHYADMRPPLDRDLVVAGGILHDIGKVVELDQQPTGGVYTPEGELVGHLLLGRDIIRDTAREMPLDGDTQLRLEHLIIAHQRLPEWGSPKAPMTPEALLVHYADDVDAKFHMFYAILRDATGDGPMTSQQNVLRQKVYRGT